MFFYDTLGAQKLDAYQQIGPMEQPVYAVSGSGPRKLVVLSGRKGALPEGQGMNTYGELCKLSFRLEQEQPNRPLLYGEALLDDGNSRQTNLALLTALCQIRIQSVSCDFSGHPYAASPFRNNRLYILYAGTESRPLGPGDGYPVSWMNTGRLDSLAVAALPYPEMLMQAGAGAIGQERRYLLRDFYCYANPSREASAGRPVTHLVLEGDIGETHCYYPIPLPGMQSATRYVLDLTLLRMGSPDPDIPVESGTYVLNGQVLPWEEADAATVLF